ncbi:hypothetical protein N496_19315 (plasmid) [Clostridium botulinum A2B3 87]|uniref:hypothetical protein n=1 Tax=Clostridium botulinum TaxID=1491 RepID=UPI0004A5A6B9|nr:hypothetical protein [Clostridium botulinum]KEI95107.1 hypothetical protein N496_19315 [Clostridium botulinum A2B3 87]
MKYSCYGCKHAPYKRDYPCTTCGKYVVSEDGESTVYVYTNWMPKVNGVKFEVGTKITNLKNGTYGEISSIKNDVAEVICQEKIIGLFKITDKLVDESARRTIDLSLLRKGIESGLLKIDK